MAATALALLTDETGPVLAFTAALIVAFVTALTTDRRQANALRVERERQAAQLRHAREMADLADVRALLDEAASALYRADRVRRKVVPLNWIAGDVLAPAEIRKIFPEVPIHLVAARDDLDALAARLAVRLGGT